jgi:hypothetical protein
MERTIWLGVGTLIVAATVGCSSNDPAPGSEVGKPSAGGGGAGGAGGSLSLGVGAGNGGLGGGGAAGAAGSTLGGSATGGSTSVAGSSNGGGSGGVKAEGMCKRVAASDAGCTELEETPSQAYACDDAASYITLSRMHGPCTNVSGLVPGAIVGACCPPP